jgi:hypothetical protein
MLTYDGGVGGTVLLSILDAADSNPQSFDTIRGWCILLQCTTTCYCILCSVIATAPELAACHHGQRFAIVNMILCQLFHCVLVDIQMHGYTSAEYG